MAKHRVRLVGAVIVVAFAWGCGRGHNSTAVEICPALGESGAALSTVTASGGRVRWSHPPEMFATAHGQSVALSHGESEWCGIVADVFHVVTSDIPLVVAPGETITVPNPLPREHLFEAGIGVQDARGEPTPTPGRLTWPFGPSGGPGHGLRYDDHGLAFTAEGTPGRYVVSLWVNLAKRADIFSSSNRSAYYALLIEVKE